MQILTLNPQECTDILQSSGFGIGYDKLTEGLRQGIFPFGVAYKMPSTQWAYVIYAKDLRDFIKNHGGEQ